MEQRKARITYQPNRRQWSLTWTADADLRREWFPTRGRAIARAREIRFSHMFIQSIPTEVRA